MKQGTLNVETSNIFPIIKKFLYSEKEIFLRELISNATDATQKLQTLVSKGEYDKELGDLTIDVIVDKDNKKLIIEDKGVGMTEDEVDKYINQIAFSSAEEFIQKYQEEGEQKGIIGHFGLGFYSSFMVSDKVEIDTLSYQDGAKPVHWECTHDTEYKIEEGERQERGTRITLHLNEDSQEFTEEDKIKEILNKFCRFMPVEIRFNEEIINDTNPIWLKDPQELTSQDYQDFYQKLYPASAPPLFWIHLNVDYPFNLTGVLYFPKISNSMEVQQNKIQLYCNQVFVTEHVEEIVPEFLTLLHGVIDSPDIPLNVSRSALQTDSNVRKISNYIVRKVADKLQEIFNNQRQEFEQKWDDIGTFIKYGMLTHEKFAEKAQSFCLVQNIEDKYFTFEEYKENVKAQQTDKNDSVILLYSTDPDVQNSYIEAVKNKGYDVLKLTHPIDSHFVNHLEQKLEGVNLKRVDADTAENIIEKDEKKESSLSQEQEESIKQTFEETAGDGFTVKTEPMSPEDPPAVITQQEFQRRMKDISKMSGMDAMSGMPENYELSVNSNHPLASRIALLPDENQKKEVARHVIDLAKLSNNMLTGKELTEFVKRSGELLAEKK